MTCNQLFSLAMLLVIVAALTLGEPAMAMGQEPPASPNGAASVEVIEFTERVQPLLKKYCLRCHNPDNMKSGIRVDQLSSTPEDRQLFLLKDIQRQLADSTMPPEDEPQPTAEQRKSLNDWIARTMTAARVRNTSKNGTVRRLTVAQYRNTLKDLLGLEETLTDVLPRDGLSKDGFTNHGPTLDLSPLQVDSFFDIAEKALDLCIVDENEKPVIQNFRVELGTAINPKPCPDNLTLGANSFLLNNADVLVTELKPDKPFAYEPFVMRTKYKFIEGYAGNDTVRGWREYDSIYHSVFACLRGTPGYPKGEAHQVVPSGLLLRPALPSAEIFGQSSTYGPMANFKISLRQLPDQGSFRVKIKAARYDDALLLDDGARVQDGAATISVAAVDKLFTIKDEGIYQVDVLCAPGKSQGLLSLSLGDRHFAGSLATETDRPTAFMLVRLPAGEMKVSLRYGDNSRLKRLSFSRLAEDSENAKRFKAFEKRLPSLGVYLGLRRDCGSTLTQVGDPRPVAGGELREYVFEGAIKNYPSPDEEKDNVNYLAGIREIGVRSEPTDGRDMPRLLVRSVEFEGPYYASWPSDTHRRIFIDSAHRDAPASYAQEVIRAFATRTFRRPVTDVELKALVRVWQNSYTRERDFRKSIKDALCVVLTSPQFLFLIENSRTPRPEDLDAYELASKLSYFLWNAPPDERLLELASQDRLHVSLNEEFDRMIRDPRFGQFTSEFASQWLSLDKFEVVAIDAQRYPKLARDVKTQLRQEPIHYLRYLFDQDLPLRNLVRSDFIVANEVVASYYNLADRVESGFQFVPIKHDNDNLGGILNHASILAGLSDGLESNPVKRGAWLARKIIAEPPDDPPPNVPQIKEDDGGKLTLREKLERHREQRSCAKCHAGIDPWGVPFEVIDAGGLLKKAKVDARATLPDGKEIHDLNALKTYLAEDRIDQVAFSFMKHVATYAIGRGLTYNEVVFLQEEGVKLKADGYRMQAMLIFVIKSDLFLKK